MSGRLTSEGKAGYGRPPYLLAECWLPNEDSEGVSSVWRQAYWAALRSLTFKQPKQQSSPHDSFNSQPSPLQPNPKSTQTNPTPNLIHPNLTQSNPTQPNPIQTQPNQTQPKPKPNSIKLCDCFKTSSKTLQLIHARFLQPRASPLPHHCICHCTMEADKEKEGEQDEETDIHTHRNE
ncbi:hypothetical protein E2C01_041118 [Portunus trituberculatus]|uniref:Uncharacterized protein n=1 Tax=Portunus trituberculatus TaxID=210409 RepID=A0A5B7FSN6_PORTR|nr:hypothetical protein [Portunus trituberculatus]